MNFCFFRKHGFCYELCDLFSDLVIFCMSLLWLVPGYFFFQLVHDSFPEYSYFLSGLLSMNVMLSVTSVFSSLRAYIIAKKHNCLITDFYKDLP